MMSLAPFPCGPHASHLINQDFGEGLTPEDLLTVSLAPLQLGGFYPPWGPAVAMRDVGSKLTADKNKIEINLDVKRFAPEELEVKTAGGYIKIEGKHEEKEDEHGFISRQFTRRYCLPDDCDPEKVESKLSSEGILTVFVPRTSKYSKNERVVPINQSGVAKKETNESGATAATVS